MPAPTKESRLPELRLSDITRSGPARRLASLRAPDFSKMERPDFSKIELPDFSKFERPNLEMPDIDLPKIDFAHIDVQKAVVGAAVSAGLVRKRRRRWPLLLGGAIIVGLIGRALMSSSAARERLAQGAQWAKQRIADMREDREPIDAVAFTAAPTKPIDDGGFVGGPSDDPWASKTADDDYPEGLGSPDPTDANGNRVPVFKDADTAARR